MGRGCQNTQTKSPACQKALNFASPEAFEVKKNRLVECP
jgi:hypothetical protein